MERQRIDMDPQSIAQTLSGAQLDPNYQPGLFSPITILKTARLLLPGYALTHPEDAMAAVNSVKGTAQSVAQALTAPHRAYTGELPVMATDPNTGETHTTPEAIGEGINFGLTAATGGGLLPEEAASLGANAPIRAYHGTTRDFSTFSDAADHNYGVGSLGHFFTEDPNYAAQYAQGPGGNIVPADLSMENPKLEGLKRLGRFSSPQEAARYRAQLLAEGYDGVKFVGPGDSSEYVAIKPGTVKSPIDGSTLYSNRAQPPLLAMMRGRKPVLESDLAAPTPVAAENAPPFYSAVQSAVESAPQAKAPGPQWLGMLKNAPGIKPEELDWLGMPQMLQQPGALTKDQLVAHILQNKPEINDVLQGPPIEAPKAPKAKPNTSPVTDQEIADVQERARTDWKALQGDLARSYGEDSGNRINARNPISGPLLDRIMADPGSIDPHIQRQALEEAALQLRKVEPKVDVEETQPEGLDTKYQQYTMPGGKNYRELLLTMPGKVSARQQFLEQMMHKHQIADEMGVQQRMTPDEIRHLHQLPAGEPSAYRSSHFDSPNVLAHVRFKDRVDANGKKTLAIEEIQSDWHQAGRKKGYAGQPQNVEIKEEPHPERHAALNGQNVYAVYVNGTRTHSYATRAEAEAHAPELTKMHQGVPDAPFKTTWHELALKRMMRWAAEHGYDQIAWTPGEVQNARYKLSQHVDELRYFPPDPSLGTTGSVFGYKGGQRVVNKFDVKPEDLPDYVGKEVADRLLNAPKTQFHIEPGHGRIGQPMYVVKDQSGVEWGRYSERSEAERALAARTKEDSGHVLSGTDLDIGGSGMKGFYDQMLPKAANKLGKKYGAQVGTADFGGGKLEPVKEGRVWMVRGVPFPDGSVRNMKFTSKLRALDYIKKLKEQGVETAVKGQQLWALPITPAMREQALTQGFPMFVNRAPRELAATLQGNNNQ